MTTPPLKKSIGRSPLRLSFFLAALAVACLALMPFAQSAQAVGPEPNEGDLIGNMAEEDDAVLDLSSVTGNAATANVTATATPPNEYIVKEVTPNKWEIRMDFTRHVMCAMEPVRFRGELHISFGVDDLILKSVGTVVVQPKTVKLVGQLPGKPFSVLGTGKKPTLGRTYVLQPPTKSQGGVTGKAPHFTILPIKFKFKAPSELPPGEVEFTVTFHLSYDVQGKEVIHLDAPFPKINCNG